MGAMPFENLAPWREDPRESLAELQAQYVNQHYDLPTLIQEHLDSARQSVEICTKNGDEYGLLNDYRANLELLESIASQPIPTSASDRVQLVRKIWEFGGEGVGNILDIEDVSDTGGLYITRLMSAGEVESHLGTGTPTVDDAKQLLGKIADTLGRAESVCFPVYEDGQTAGWWFAGYTLD